jgi:hypothetical protein
MGHASAAYRDPLESAVARVDQLERVRAELLASTAGSRRAHLRRRAGVAAAFAVLAVTEAVTGGVVPRLFPGLRLLDVAAGVGAERHESLGCHDLVEDDPPVFGAEDPGVGEGLRRRAELRRLAVNQVVAHSPDGSLDADMVGVDVFRRDRLYRALEVVAVDENATASNPDRFDGGFRDLVEVDVEMRRRPGGGRVALRVPVHHGEDEGDIVPAGDLGRQRQVGLVVAFAFAGLVDDPVAVEVEAATGVVAPVRQAVECARREGDADLYRRAGLAEDGIAGDRALAERRRWTGDLGGHH